MYSAFQFGFQTGYQVIYPKESIPAYNGNSTKRSEYVPRASELQYLERQNQLYKLQQAKKVAEEERRANEYRIEALELQRLRESLADQELQLELLELLKASQLLQEQVAIAEENLRRFMMDEEALVVLLMSMPFH